MGDRVAPGKLELLLRLSEQQMAFSNAFLKGNWEKSRKDLDAADTWFSRFDRGVSSYLDTAALFRRHYDQSFDVTSVINTWLNGLSIHADVLQSKGDLAGAERLRSRQLEVSGTYLEEAGRAEVERGRAASLISQGRFNEALAALMAARDYFQRHGDDLKQARVTIDIVDLLQWLGDYERAATQLNRASEIVDGRLQGGAPTTADVLGSLFAGLSDIATGRGDGRQAVNRVELYRIATELDYYKGLIARALGDYEAAKRQFDKVMPEYAKMGVGPAIEFQLGACELGAGDAAAAYRRLSALEKTFLEGGLLRQKLAGLLRVEGEALIELGRTEEALDKLRTGIVDLETYYDPDLQWRLQWQEGRGLQADGRDREALAAFEAAADTVDSLRKAPLGHRLDSTYLTDKQPLFGSAIALACRLGEGARCARLIEMVKSRALTATMSVAGERQANSTLDCQIDALTRELDSIEFKGFHEGNAQKYRAERQGLLAERAELIERARATDPRWRVLTEPVAFDLDAIQSVLRRRGQAALTLYRDGDALTAVLITGSTAEAASMQLAASTLARLKTYADGMEANEQDSVLNDVSLSLAIGARHLIPQPLLDNALSQDSLVVVPHGLLHLVPWAGLIYQGKRLFQYCPVGVLPNLSCLLSLDAPLNRTPALALIGAPDYGSQGPGGLSSLPEAEREIESVSAHYGAKGRLIDKVKTGRAATESAFWRLIAHDNAKHAILHVVCHGVPEPFEPLNAGLLLADAKIDAAEISRSRIPFDEVVLSACSTGWRPVKVGGIELRGDDILGLPGAFLEAGARSILVSIPKANDTATATFMSWYQEYRAEGKTPLAALQRTQKRMLGNDSCKPFMWIGITAYSCQ